MTERSLKDDCAVGISEVTDSCEAVAFADAEPPHRVEMEVQRHLLSDPSFSFSSLVVSRIKDGVCLRGVVEMDDAAPDVGDLARRVSGVSEVLNRLVVRARCSAPAKG